MNEELNLCVWCDVRPKLERYHDGYDGREYFYYCCPSCHWSTDFKGCGEESARKQWNMNNVPGRDLSVCDRINYNGIITTIPEEIVRKKQAFKSEEVSRLGALVFKNPISVMYGDSIASVLPVFQIDLGSFHYKYVPELSLERTKARLAMELMEMYATDPNLRMECTWDEESQFYVKDEEDINRCLTCAKFRNAIKMADHECYHYATMDLTYSPDASNVHYPHVGCKNWIGEKKDD